MDYRSKDRNGYRNGNRNEEIMEAKRMIKVIEQEFSVCRLAAGNGITDEKAGSGFSVEEPAVSPGTGVLCAEKFTEMLCMPNEICFIGKTDEELSLVCPTESAPATGWEREDGWKAFRLQGVLDFSLIGVLADISSVLAEGKIGIFVVSTFNTDYVLTKKENFDRAMELLSNAGYQIPERK